MKKYLALFLFIVRFTCSSFAQNDDYAVFKDLITDAELKFDKPIKSGIKQINEYHEIGKNEANIGANTIKQDSAWYELHEQIKYSKEGFLMENTLYDNDEISYKYNLRYDAQGRYIGTISRYDDETYTTEISYMPNGLPEVLNIRFLEADGTFLKNHRKHFLYARQNDGYKITIIVTDSLRKKEIISVMYYDKNKKKVSGSIKSDEGEMSITSQNTITNEKNTNITTFHIGETIQMIITEVNDAKNRPTLIELDNKEEKKIEKTSYRYFSENTEEINEVCNYEGTKECLFKLKTTADDGRILVKVQKTTKGSGWKANYEYKQYASKGNWTKRVITHFPIVKGKVTADNTKIVQIRKINYYE